MKTLVWISMVIVLVSSSYGLVRGQTEDTGAQVTLNIFSGRLDPTWTLSASQTEVLRQILASLPPSSSIDAPGNLGFRGFYVELDSTSIYIFNNHVEYGDQWLETRGRALEIWLLGTAGDTLEPDLAAEVWANLTALPPAFAIYLVGDYTRRVRKLIFGRKQALRSVRSLITPKTRCQRFIGLPRTESCYPKQSGL